MRLTEVAFTEIVDAGCTCGKKSLVIEAYVAQALPLMGGEPFGQPSWAYKGEDLVHGTYRIACADCDRELFSSASCPRCDTPDMLARALERENGFALPVTCQCGSELTTVTAFVPAVVLYEGERGAKARTQTAPEDPGFHAFRADCKQCRTSTEQRVPCPLCA